MISQSYITIFRFFLFTIQDCERFLYEHCKKLDITLITISHRASLWKHHQKVLRFVGKGGKMHGGSGADDGSAAAASHYTYTFDAITEDTEPFGS